MHFTMPSECSLSRLITRKVSKATASVFSSLVVLLKKMANSNLANCCEIALILYFRVVYVGGSFRGTALWKISHLTLKEGYKRMDEML